MHMGTYTYDPSTVTHTLSCRNQKTENPVVPSALSNSTLGKMPGTSKGCSSSSCCCWLLFLFFFFFSSCENKDGKCESVSQAG